MNHDFISSKKNITPELLLPLLKEINDRRFNGVFAIEQIDQSDLFKIEYVFDNRYYGFTCWSISKRKLEFRKAMMGAYNCYVSYVFTEELAKSLQGKCSGGSTSSKWDPEPDKYKTFKEYFAMYDGAFNALFWRSDETPKNLKCL